MRQPFCIAHFSGEFIRFFDENIPKNAKNIIKMLVECLRTFWNAFDVMMRSTHRVARVTFSFFEELKFAF